MQSLFWEHTQNKKQRTTETTNVLIDQVNEKTNQELISAQQLSVNKSGAINQR
jgi:hypothetical protein